MNSSVRNTARKAALSSGTRRAPLPFQVAILVMLTLAASCLWPDAARPAAAAGSGVLIPWAVQSETRDSNRGPVPPAQAMQDAQNFNFLTAHVVSYAGEVPAMKAVNPSLKVFAYMNASFAQSNEGTAFASQDYAVDAQGHRITQRKSGNFLMDPSQQDWINTRITECETDIKQSGYDGCYLDLLGAAPLDPSFVTAPPIDHATNKPWTRGQWLNATANLAATLHTAVHPMVVYGHPVLVYGNGLTNGGQFYQPGAPSSVLLNSLDGGIAEAWLRQQINPATFFPNTAEWLLNVKMIVAVEATGKPLLTLTKMWVPATSAQQSAWLEFALATFLMGTQGRSAFSFSPGFQIPRTTPLPWVNTALGSPSGQYLSVAGATGVYQRSFATGLVLVNTDANPHTVTLKQTYYNLNRQPITSAAMAPHTGLLLTTS